MARALRPWLGCCVALLLGPWGPAQAEPLTAPRLGAASNFGQGWQPAMLSAADALPLGLYRDAVYWAVVEGPDGSRAFEGPRAQFPELLADAGADLIFIVNNGHPAHDGGHTPHSPEAVAAFAAYAAAAVSRFPAITAVEVGNEMNSDTFVSGPGWDGDLDLRARSYVKLLEATAASVRRARPEVRILGGAAHSIPLAWLRSILEAGAAQHMDALVIHPYTVAPEQLARQIALLRGELSGAEDLPMAVTEFGTEDAAEAPDYLVRFYCQMALSNVSDAVWYPLNPRGDGLVPLISRDGSLTAAGRAFRLVASLFQGRAVSAIAPDPFTYGCRFGPDRMVIWGEPRSLTLTRPGIEVRDATGTVLPPEGLSLSMQHPLVLTADDGTIGLGNGIALGAQGVLADSLHQFAYPGSASTDPFERFVRTGGELRPLELRPGQEKSNAPWTPYLGTKSDGLARATAEWVLPSRPAAGPIDIVYRYAAPAPQVVDARILVAPASRSTDGVQLTVTLDGKVLRQMPVTSEFTLELDALSLSAGAQLDVTIGPGQSGRGDVTQLQVTLLRPDP